MKLKSTRLGELDIDEKQVIDFPGGIPGFEDERRFAIIPLGDEAVFFYMHSLADPDICLMLAVPFVFFPDYEVELPEEELETLGVEGEDGDHLAVFVVLTVPEDFKKTTANLLGPVVINTATRTGIQFVPAASRYTVRHPIFGDAQALTDRAIARQGL